MAVALEELVGPAGAEPHGVRRVRPRLRVVGPEERRVGPGGGRRSRRHRKAVYVRRRFAVAVALAGVVAAATVVATPLLTAASAPAVAEGTGGGGTSVAAGDRQGTPAMPATVVIAQGQTVWDRVSGHTPAGMSRHEWVAQVLELNDVDPLAVVPGTTLQLPTGQ